MDNQDLYSEKIKKLIGPIPKWLTALSLSIYCLILVSMIIAFALIFLYEKNYGILYNMLNFIQ